MDDARTERRFVFVRRLVITVLATLVVCIAGTGLWVGSRWDGYWEGTLSGPFHGREYEGPLTEEPVNSLSLDSGELLEVYEIPNVPAPAVVMRNASGDVLWTRLLVPETSNTADEIREHVLTDLKLLSWQSRDTGFAVRIGCYWDGGGRENGLIYLNERFQFLHFKLGW